MATTLIYSISPYIPFTKILSADANQDKTDIQNRINWAGGTDATTGLGDDNVQSNTAAGGALTRATKLKKGTANYAVFNDGTGAMTEAASLPLQSGGTGSVLVIGNEEDTLQVISGVIVFGVPPVPPSLRPVSFHLYS